MANFEIPLTTKENSFNIKIKIYLRHGCKKDQTILNAHGHGAK